MYRLIVKAFKKMNIPNIKLLCGWVKNVEKIESTVIFVEKNILNIKLLWY
jgi:hypothetical protein